MLNRKNIQLINFLQYQKCRAADIIGMLWQNWMGGGFISPSSFSSNGGGHGYKMHVMSSCIKA